MFRYLVLGLLRNGDARHGYALIKDYRKRTGQEASSGNFYRELQRLVGERLVRTAANPPGADPRRAPYQITETGSAVFDAWLFGSDGTSSGFYENELSARGLFLAEAERDLVSKTLERWREELWLSGKTLERGREVAIVQGARGGGGGFSTIVLLIARRLKHIAADLEFVDEFRAAYDRWHSALAAVEEAGQGRPVPRRGREVPRSKIRR